MYASFLGQGCKNRLGNLACFLLLFRFWTVLYAIARKCLVRMISDRFAKQLADAESMRCYPGGKMINTVNQFTIPVIFP